MAVKQRTSGKKGKFFIEDGGKQVAFMSYVFSDDATFVIEHTVVEAAYEGKGLGKQLVKAAVDFARENNYRIIPQCPYAKTVFEHTPDYNDVLLK